MRGEAARGAAVGFTIMEFAGTTDPIVVYLENLSGALFLDRDYHVGTYAGTDDGRGTDPGLDTERLTLM
jgi:hypothetical protein